jgi:hypothetical protein
LFTLLFLSTSHLHHPILWHIIHQPSVSKHKHFNTIASYEVSYILFISFNSTSDSKQRHPRLLYSRTKTSISDVAHYPNHKPTSTHRIEGQYISPWRRLQHLMASLSYLLKVLRMLQLAPTASLRAKTRVTSSPQSRFKHSPNKLSMAG